LEAPPLVVIGLEVEAAVPLAALEVLLAALEEDAEVVAALAVDEPALIVAGFVDDDVPDATTTVVVLLDALTEVETVGVDVFETDTEAEVEVTVVEALLDCSKVSMLKQVEGYHAGYGIT
jgi:hypothetical protein